MRERLVLILVVLSFSLFPPRAHAEQSEQPAGDAPHPDAATAFAHLSTDGLIGGVHVVDAKSGAPGTFRIALLGHSFRRDGFIAPGDGHRSNGGKLTLNVVPIDHLELAASVVAYASQNGVSDPNVVQVLGDLHFFAKGFVAVRPWLWLGGDVEVALLNDVGDLGIAGDATSVGLRSSATADLRALTEALPLIARGNLRYRFDNSAKLVAATERARYDSLPDPGPPADEARHLINPAERYALQIDRLDMLSLSLGVEMPLAPHERVAVRPMVEWGFGLPINRQSYVCVRPQPGERDGCLAAKGFDARPSNLTAGVRVQPYLPGLAVLLAVDVATSGSRTFVRELAPTSRYMLHFGLSYAYDPPAIEHEPQPAEEPEKTARPRTRRRQQRMRGHIRGQVVDATTGEPVIEAVVHFEDAAVSDVVTDAGGAFRSAELPPGPQSLLVHARGYAEARCTAVVPDSGDDGRARCTLTQTTRTGELRGRVMDRDGRALAGAEISIDGPRAMRFLSSEDGTFRGEQVPEGSYALRVDAPGHFPVHASARVEAGSVDETPALRLYPRPSQPEVRVRDDRIVLSRPIAFEKKSATLSPSSFSLLAEVADLLISHPEIRRVEVQGHVASRKSAEDDRALSEDRARAVCDWLTARGVASERLSPMGFGRSEPLVPNITPTNRAKNSRIELLIR